MNKEELLKLIAGTLKIDVKILTKELEKDTDIKIELPELNSFTADELVTRDKNITKASYDEGVTVGFDKSAKKLKEVSGVEIEGLDITKIAGAITSKANTDAKVEPNTKISELTKSIETLQGTVTTLTGEKETIEGNFVAYKNESAILSEMPANNAGLSNTTVLTEMRANGYEFTSEGVTKNGELLKDNIQNPQKRGDIFNQFLTEKKWLKADKSGRGGADEAGKVTSTGIKTIEDYQNYCDANNINSLSDEGKAILVEARETNKF